MERRTQQTAVPEERSHLMFSEEREWPGVGLEATDWQVSMSGNDPVLVKLCVMATFLHQIQYSNYIEI